MRLNTSNIAIGKLTVAALCESFQPHVCLNGCPWAWACNICVNNPPQSGSLTENGWKNCVVPLKFVLQRPPRVSRVLCASGGKWARFHTHYSNVSAGLWDNVMDTTDWAHEACDRVRIMLRHLADCKASGATYLTTIFEFVQLLQLAVGPHVVS